MEVGVGVGVGVGVDVGVEVGSGVGVGQASCAEALEDPGVLVVNLVKLPDPSGLRPREPDSSGKQRSPLSP